MFTKLLPFVTLTALFGFGLVMSVSGAAQGRHRPELLLQQRLRIVRGLHVRLRRRLPVQ